MQVDGIDRVGNARRFAHPPLVRWLARCSVAVCAPALLATFVLAPAARTAMEWLVVASSLAFFGALLPVSVSIVRRSRDIIVVTDEGLERRSRGEGDLFLAWDDVAAVEPWNVMQRLVVRDRGGARRIDLEYHLENFGELRRVVLERSKQAAARGPRPRQ